MYAGFLVDYCGRKETIVINDAIFLLGTIMLSASHNYVVLVCPVVLYLQGGPKNLDQFVLMIAKFPIHCYDLYDYG